jgi:hypothetical protein
MWVRGVSPSWYQLRDPRRPLQLDDPRSSLLPATVIDLCSPDREVHGEDLDRCVGGGLAVETLRLRLEEGRFETGWA